ncbi:MAG: hypothetical protein CFE21_05820 [Bacteroidetes bacterium B1(2017)]|nr:MAG: hypothetical protein CFE21_05820 [Bacteroidetes bacterium B1(2017)]
MKSLHQHHALFPILASELHTLLTGYSLIDAYRNQQASEFTLVFEKGSEKLSIQLNTEAKTGLFFFYEYPLERTGAVFPLFKELLGSEVLNVQAHQHNRSFFFSFGSNQSLVFKLYGPLSNVIYYKENEVVQLYRSSIENDRFLPMDGFNQEPSHSETYAFKGTFFVLQTPDKEVKLCFEPIDKDTVLFETEVIFEALNSFSKYYLQSFLFSTQKNKLLGQYKQKIKRQVALLFGATQFLKHAAESVPFDEVGHILMANLHLIHKGEKEVTLTDFYRNTEIIISLKKDLSPADNAAYYYQKAKNRKHELALKQKQVETCLILLAQLKENLAKIEAAQHLKDLRSWIKEEKVQSETPLKEKFRRFECEGYLIYVGKNAKNNDELTLKFAHKDDLWLHAKGVSGSHVIIKHKTQQNFPEPVIRKAAQLAAHYSGSAGSAMVPVIYTPKKYVRKPKGAHAGQVSVEREEIALVEPWEGK